jgi:3-oxoacyl-[acyl-carrier protein] reductase
VAVVTGAARGIGLATAAAMVRCGARVALLDRDGDGLGNAAESLAAAEAAILPLQADVTDPGAVADAVGRIVSAWDRLDILVNNAGILRDATLENLTVQSWDETLSVNLKGAMLCARAAVPHMVKNGHGRILSASSVVARTGNYGQTSYTAAKGGLIAMTRTWARELGPKGITANAVAPGIIETEMARAIPPKVLAQFIPRIAARRLGRPEEVAAVYVFLASDLASFINGAVVGVDGGLML